MRKIVISGFLNYKKPLRKIEVKDSNGDKRIAKMIDFGISENGNLKFVTAWDKEAEIINEIPKGTLVLVACHKHMRNFNKFVKDKDGNRLLNKEGKPINVSKEQIIAKKIETDIGEINKLQKMFDKVIKDYIDGNDKIQATSQNEVNNLEEIAKEIILENIDEVVGTTFFLEEFSDKLMEKYLMLGFYFTTIKKCYAFTDLMPEEVINKTDEFISKKEVYINSEYTPLKLSRNEDYMARFKEVGLYGVAMIHCKVEELIQRTFFYKILSENDSKMPITLFQDEADMIKKDIEKTESIENY